MTKNILLLKLLERRREIEPADQGRGIVLGDRGDVCDARAVSDMLRRPKSPSQCLIVRCRPSDGRASPSVVEVSGNRKRPMPAVQYIQ